MSANNPNSGNPGRHYSPKFYRELESAQESAREILPLVLGLLKPTSVIDIGCGTGRWLATATELGVKDIFGVDGSWVKDAKLVIPREKFREHDLTIPLKLDCRFDLALSLEVGEHLPACAARLFVQSLCDVADVVIFSAAIPGQGGRRHINEQWPAYWADIFQEFGYDCFDFLRPQIWNNPRVTWYYAQNTLIFARAGAGTPFGQPVRPFAVVHPALWSAQVERMNSPGKLLERLPKAVMSRLAGKKGTK